MEPDREEERSEQVCDRLDPQQDTDPRDERDLTGEGQEDPAIDLELFDLVRVPERSGHVEQRKEQ